MAATISSSSWSLRRQSTTPAARRASSSRARGRGQAQNGDVRALAPERDRRLDAVHSGEAEVHHGHVGIELLGGGDRAGAFGHRSNDVDSRLQLEQEDERLAEHVVVLDQEDANIWVSVTGSINPDDTAYSAESKSG